MDPNPIISRITIYPIKSLDGVSLETAEIVKGGCLQHDREYAIMDEDYNFINGKANPLVNGLRTSFDLSRETVSFRHENDKQWQSFHLQKERKGIDSYLSHFFGLTAMLHLNKEGRFLDIPDTSGMTVLSTASLETVASWYNGMDLEDTRKRFRATIELAGVPPFWEDHLFLEDGTAIEFRLGDCTLYGMQPRARCIVPTRHPLTGEVTHAFPKTFALRRKESLPPWSTLEEYGHSYYLSADCHIPASETGKWIRVGDPLKIIGRRHLP